MTKLLLLIIVVLGVFGSLALSETLPLVWISPANNSLSLVEEFKTARGEWTSEQYTGVGGRASAPIIHADSKGLLWIFGGANGNNVLNRAMWNYNPLTDEYRWVAGTNDTAAPTMNLGEKGVPSPDVYPPQLKFAASAIDNDDNIWIYGGVAPSGVRNEMYMFNTTSLEFTWIGGDASNMDYQTGMQGEPSSSVWPGKLYSACVKADSNGDLWLFGGEAGMWRTNRVWRFNTASRWWTFIGGNATVPLGIDYSDPQWNGRLNTACTIDTDDRVWLFGGFSTDSALNGVSVWADMWSYDTTTTAWTLEFGDASSYQTTGNVVLFNNYSPDSFPAARQGAQMVDRRDGTLMMVGGFSWSESPLGYGSYEDIWVFNKTSKMWKIVAGNWNTVNTLPTYGEYRVVSGILSSRGYFGAATDLTNRGNFIMFGGETGGACCFTDMWLIEQDECTVGTDNCDTNAQCTNTDIGFTCTCDSGYSGDGLTCDDVNECSDGTDNCGADEECVNTRGSFTCQPVTGPQSSAPQSSTPQSAPKAPTSGSVASVAMVGPAVVLAVCLYLL